MNRRPFAPLSKALGFAARAVLPAALPVALATALLSAVPALNGCNAQWPAPGGISKAATTVSVTATAVARMADILAAFTLFGEDSAQDADSAANSTETLQ